MGQIRLLTGSPVCCGGDGSSEESIEGRYLINNCIEIRLIHSSPRSGLRVDTAQGTKAPYKDAYNRLEWSSLERRETGLGGLHPAVSRSAASPGDLWAALISLRLICISGSYPGREGPDHSHRLDNCRLGMSKLYDRMCRVNIDLGRDRGFTLSHRQFLRQGDWKEL